MADAQFDYVIVGAGTAGCALAGRLAEDPDVRVCLLEAGGSDAHPFVRTPALVGAGDRQPRVNWRFETVPQAHLNGRRIPQPRGKVVGGSGSINGMVYSRGHPRDYDDWAAAGATGWSFAEVLPYFTRSENNEDYPPSVYHGRGGPMNVRSIARPNRLNRDFIEATASLGFPPGRGFQRRRLRGRRPAAGSHSRGQPRDDGARVPAGPRCAPAMSTVFTRHSCIASWSRTGAQSGWFMSATADCAKCAPRGK